MKKQHYLVGIGVIIVVAAVFLLTTGHSNETSAKTSSTSSSSSTSNKSGSFSADLKNACDVLTQSVATNLLGAGATKGDTSAANTETDSVKVTDCSYSSADFKSTVSILARVAKDQSGADTNANQFSGTTNVSGYGDKAYWSDTYGQFNILAHNNWYILSYGSLTPTQRTQADAQKFADAIKSQL